MRKIRLVTHTDLDGIGCALVAKVYAAQQKDVHLMITFCSNDEVDRQVTAYIDRDKYPEFAFDEMYITDLSVKDDVAKLIDSSGFTVKLLDHHIAARDLNKYSWATVKVVDEVSQKLTCGTELLYNELFPTKENTRLAQFVRDVTSWDTWRWKSEGTRMPMMYSTLLHLRGRERFMEELLPKLEGDIDIPHGWEELMYNEDIKKKDYVEDKKHLTFEYEYEGKPYLCVCASNYVSELGNVISEENPDYAGVIILNDGSVSMRTVRDDTDLSIIAKKLGGGGHKQAAGFSITAEKMKKIFDIILESEGK